jgi:hypothetical protein
VKSIITVGIVFGILVAFVVPTYQSYRKYMASRSAPLYVMRTGVRVEFVGIASYLGSEEHELYPRIKTILRAHDIDCMTDGSLAYAIRVPKGREREAARIIRAFAIRERLMFWKEWND